MGTFLESRRRFIQLGVAGTAALTAVGGGLRFFGAFGYSHRLAPQDLPIALSAKEFAVVKALCEILLPETPGFPSGESLGVPQRIDEEVWATSPRLASDLKTCLQLLEHAPVMVGHFGRFSALDPEVRARAFQALLTSQTDVLVQISVGLKEMVHFFYYVRKETWTGIGYEGPFVPEAVPPESSKAYAALLASRRNPA